ncbi:outer membrane protein assembly factor BamB family protein [Slackia equolifaciens]|nr:PQQ-binding-like beta-propeller repeat protein [Slackia equolifaciens]
MNGCKSRRAIDAAFASVSKRLLACMVSLVLVCGLIPSAAWAQAAASSDNAPVESSMAADNGAGANTANDPSSSAASDATNEASQDSGESEDDGQNPSAPSDAQTGAVTGGDSSAPDPEGSGDASSNVVQDAVQNGAASGANNQSQDVSSSATNTEASSVTSNNTEKTPAANGEGESQDADDQQDESAITVAFFIIGVDAQGKDQLWLASADYEVEKGSSAADLSDKAFKEHGITAQTSMSEYGWSLDSVTSPYDPSLTLAFDSETWDYWQLFVNGKASDLGASSVELASGDSVVWYYSAYGDELPDESTLPGGSDEDSGEEGEGSEGDSGEDSGEESGEGDGTTEVDGVTIDPDAERPDWDSSWPGFGASGEGAQSAPAGDVEEAWVSQIKESSDWATNVSEPIVAGDYVYVAAGTTLYAKNKATGETIATAKLVAATNSVTRMVYTQGLVIVPLDGGRLQALTADTLTTVWVTKATDQINDTGVQQSLSTLTVGDGCVYYGTAAAGWSSSYSGYLMCVSLKDGSTIWHNVNESKGYYWSGVALSGSWAIVGDDSGSLVAVDASTGAQASSISLGSAVRSTIVAGSETNTFFAVSTDGVLHKVALGGDGVLTEVASVKFGSSSTSTPVVSGGRVYVGGASLEGEPNQWGYMVYGGQLSVIDEATLAIEHQVTQADGSKLPADSKSTPLVSQQGGQTYVYFTCNAEPGGIYRYRVGDAEAHLIYTPAEGNQNYTMSSVACDSDGTLYYINDSGALFAVKGVVTGGGDEPGSKPGDDQHGGNTGGSGGSSGESAGGQGGSTSAGANPVHPQVNQGATFVVPAGTVAAGMSPIAAGSSVVASMQKAAQTNEGVTRGEATGSEAKATALSSSSARGIAAGGSAASSNGGEDIAPVLTESAPAWAFVGLGAGVVCLVAAGFWLFATRRP